MQEIGVGAGTRDGKGRRKVHSVIPGPFAASSRTEPGIRFLHRGEKIPGSVRTSSEQPRNDEALGSPNPESRIPNPESRIPNPESRIPNPESRVPSPDSRIPTPDSPIPPPDSPLPPPSSHLPALLPRGSRPPRAPRGALPPRRRSPTSAARP